MHVMKKLVAFSLAAASAATSVFSQEPQGDPTGGFSLGSVLRYHKLPLSQRAFVFRNMEELDPYPVRAVRHGAHASPLPSAPQIDVNVTIDGISTNLTGYMEANQVAAMIVLRDGKVVAERYRMGNRPDSRWIMHSVTKSVTSTLVGMALRDGSISSIDDPLTKYLPELKGSAWDGVTIKQTLQMSSGIDLHDVYEGDMPQGLVQSYVDRTPNAPMHYLVTLARTNKPGTHFSYSGANTYILGRIVAVATGKSLSDYLSEKIWVPMGMEDDAYWRLDQDGQEIAPGGLSATLRDMGRFGLFVLHDGMVGKTSAVPTDWFKDATATKGAGYLAPGAMGGYSGLGYGYQWWTLLSGGPRHQIGDDGAFLAIGIYGQQIYVLPKQNMVVVIQSATKEPVPVAALANGQLVVEALAEHPVAR